MNVEAVLIVVFVLHLASTHSTLYVSVPVQQKLEKGSTQSLLTLLSIEPYSGLLDRNLTSNKLLTQFFLDPASLNLPDSHRINFQHPRLHELYSFSRDWCHAVYNHRAKLLIKHP